MGLGDTIARWGSAAKKTTQQLTLDTACYVAWHGLPYYVALSDAADSHPLLADLWRGACRIFTQDVVPMVVAQSINQGVQSALQEYHNPVAESFKMGVQLAASVVVFTRAIEGSARTVVLTVEAGRVLSGLDNANTARYKQLCEECTSMRFIQGAARDFAAYAATEWLISNTQYLPFVGSSVAKMGSLWNSGGYVCSTIMPICDRHLDKNKQQHPAFFIAVGLHHAAMTALVSYLIQVTMRSPGDLYRNFWDPESQFNTEISADHSQHYYVLVNQLCLILEMMLAANMNWPEPVSEATRYPNNPFLAFKRLVGFPFDTLAKGAKMTVPPLIRAANSDRAVWVEKKVQDAWNHPMWFDPRLDYPKVALSWLSWALFPEMLYHEGGFDDSMLGPKGSLAQDAVIGPIWNRWRETTIAAITALEDERKKALFQFISWAAVDKSKGGAEPTMFVTWEKMAKYTVKEIALQLAKLAGHPEARELGVPLLKAINNDFIIRMLRYLHAGLEGKELPELPKCSSEGDFAALRESMVSDVVVERREVPKLPPCPSSTDVFSALRGSTESVVVLRRRMVPRRSVGDSLALLGRPRSVADVAVNFPDESGSRITELLDNDEATKEPLAFINPAVEERIAIKPSSPSGSSQVLEEAIVTDAPSAPISPTAEAPVVLNVLSSSVNSQTVRELTSLSKAPLQHVNSQNVRAALSLKSASSKPKPSDQARLGLRRHSVFAESAKASPWVMPAAGEGRSEQELLEANLLEAMMEQMGDKKDGVKRVTY